MNPIINENDQVKQLLEQIRTKSPNSDRDEIHTILDSNAKILLRNRNVSDINQLSVATNCLRIFRLSCPLGADIQCYIANELPVFEYIEYIINNPELQSETNQITIVSWQVLCNLIINNSSNQQTIWDKFNDLLVTCLTKIGYPHKDICRMIIYNIYCIGGLIQDKGQEFLKILLQNLDELIHHGTMPEFLQIFLEHFITTQKRITRMYLTLDSKERISMLNFIADYVKESETSNSPISTELLQCISKEFKKKSDCILKTESSYLNRIEPKEVMALLEVISSAAGEVSYRNILADDGSLFLNIGCLLRNVQALGKKEENIFSPIQKLEQIAPSSTSRSGIETDVSYSLKTMLIKAIGNLAYRNTKNQDLAREMEIIVAVLDCTHMDARNPLIKEWSILAIRNLCEGNMENQELIAGLTKVGDADNSDILKEFNIDLGSMRINPSR